MTERTLLEQGLQQLNIDFHPQAVDNLLHFSEMLLEKNKVMNLTAVLEPEEVVKRHFLDCAALVPYLSEGKKVLDVGTGAGFPGIPLAILCPHTEFVLLDAQRKRIDFLNEVIKAISLTNCTAIHARAEEYAKEHREQFDCAVSRAVADLRMLSELALPMVRVGGRFLAMKASDCEEEIHAASHAVSLLGGGEPQRIGYTVPFDGIERAMVQIEKTDETPAQYPRRFKKIQTSPL